MPRLDGMKVAVVGGSIAGCAAAVRFQQLGAEVIVFERSRQEHVGRGAGIVLPEVFIKQCIAMDFFDQTLPFLSPTSRSFFLKQETASKKLWEQPSFAVSAFNWGDIFKNLRRRLDANYHAGVEVHSFTQTQSGYDINTSEGNHHVDLIIAADGIDSIIRKQLFPTVSPTYAGYIAWRGVTDKFNNVDLGFFKEKVPYYVFPHGHILLYLIPAPDYCTSGKALLNWVMFEEHSKEMFQELLIDKNHHHHTNSLPPGSLKEEQVNYLHQFARKVLPNFIADIICQTEKPFLQAVFDFRIPQYVVGRVCFVGDAATVLRPHSASGTLKALKDAIALGEVFKKYESQPLDALLAEWNFSQQKMATQEIALASQMGQALVTQTPNWENMNAELMESWWNTVMTGKSWYATPTKTLFTQQTVSTAEEQRSTPVLRGLAKL